MEKAFDKLYGKLKHEAIKIKRQAKAVAELETPFERNLREATSNKRWGCPNSVLHELCVDAQTYKYRQKIMTRALESLNGNQEKWRRILKTLIMLEYLVKNGGENIADELRGEQFTFRRLASFQCREDGQDRGGGVREKAENLVKLLNDKDLLRSERDQAKLHHTKLTGGGPTAMGGGRSQSSGSSGSNDISKVVSSALNDALGEFRPGGPDTRSLSSSQAAELERRFNRLKEEQMAERAAKERGGNRLEERSAGSRSPRDEERSGPKEDKYGLFDPSFAPRDGNDSDSDQSPSRVPGKQAPAPAVDLLDMDDGEPSRAAPYTSAPEQVDEGWADFCTPSTSSAPSMPRDAVPKLGFGPPPGPANNLMDFVSSPAAPAIPAEATSFTAFDEDPFDGSDFKSAAQPASSSAGIGTVDWTSGGQSNPTNFFDPPFANGTASGYAQPSYPQPSYALPSPQPTSDEGAASGTFLDGMGASAMCNFDASTKAPEPKPESSRDALEGLDAFRLGA